MGCVCVFFSSLLFFSSPFRYTLTRKRRLPANPAPGIVPLVYSEQFWLLFLGAVLLAGNPLASPAPSGPARCLADKDQHDKYHLIHTNIAFFFSLSL